MAADRGQQATLQCAGFSDTPGLEIVAHEDERGPTYSRRLRFAVPRPTSTTLHRIAPPKCVSDWGVLNVISTERWQQRRFREKGRGVEQQRRRFSAGEPLGHDWEDPSISPTGKTGDGLIACLAILVVHPSPKSLSDLGGVAVELRAEPKGGPVADLTVGVATQLDERANTPLVLAFEHGRG